ncbi:DNA cytosine methyltransferase [Acholeplasma equirhinis]|uniref:DNA cytosine methyltransferase n=1 Tax=Acholeplasma equirhinis TaxID=555393 RepID=UPI00197B0195|nr:DNA cytosine methyltransferase [Acholeplasma equirhinis]MBN3490529.1 DNA cytosine methyltransferase [Acholeplasma equirhinis]
MKKAISLFSSSGIGDLALRNNNISVVIANELLPNRSKLYQQNFPESYMIQGDIWEKKDYIIDYYKMNYDENPFLIMATPPCQGMSSNGMGKLLSEFRLGNRERFDPRNRLIIPTIEIIKELKPDWVIFENVPNMDNTIILDENDEPIKIVDYIFRELTDYVGKAEVVNTADYGIPQIRKRLITILSRNKDAIEYFKKYGTFMPNPTHSDRREDVSKWITLHDAIGHLPPLDAIKGQNSRKDYNVFHKVSVMDPKKYEWIKHTKEGDSAFNNQCINPNCMYQKNKLHGAKHDESGIYKSNKTTPLYCEKCGHLLPRPYVKDKKTGDLRIMSGYTSAYKRMLWDMPASTITMNFPYVSSDNKVHPTQNRTLSIYEALILQTISQYTYKFEIANEMVSESLIIETIGESVPPLLIDKILQNILKI